MHVEIPEGLSSMSAEECRACHEEIYREWSESMHANAWKDPYYQVDYVFDGSQQICLNCHIPLENQQPDLVLGFRDRDKFDPILRPNPDFDPVLRDEGVTCAVCHVKDGRIVGPFQTDNAPHPVAVDPDMRSGIKYCDKCHVVGGRRWDTFFKFPPCGTVAEIEERGQKPDCVGCHMPPITRPVAEGMPDRDGRRHLFRGGHYPEMVSSALRVEYRRERLNDRVKFTFILTNTGAAHYLPTGTPDRHLTLELRLFDRDGRLIKEKIYKMKRYILWRPFIIDLWDTRLPYGLPKKFTFKFREDKDNPLSILDVTVRYHLLDEARRKKIGYRNREPIAYPVFRERIDLEEYE
jgi:hypothetical protein